MVIGGGVGGAAILYWLTRLGYPLARLVQGRFGRQSLAALAGAVRQGAAVVTP